MFKLQFNTGNAAFDDAQGFDEIETIFQDVMERIRLGDLQGKVRDSNGNTIGDWSLSPVDEE